MKKGLLEKKKIQNPSDIHTPAAPVGAGEAGEERRPKRRNGVSKGWSSSLSSKTPARSPRRLRPDRPRRSSPGRGRESEACRSKYRPPGVSGRFPRAKADLQLLVRQGLAQLLRHPLQVLEGDLPRAVVVKQPERLQDFFFGVLFTL